MARVVFTEWNPMAVINMAKRASRENLEKASQLLINAIREDMLSAKTGRMYGTHQASAEGESPAVLSGKLFDALEYKIMETNDGLISRIGVNVMEEGSTGYAVYLELGTSKMGARPYLRSTLFKNEANIRRILGG